MQRALEATGLCLWDFDVPTGRIYISESWSELLGGAPQETRTTFAELAALVPESQRAALYDNLTSTLKQPERHYRVEHQVRRLDGRYFWILTEGRVIARTADGRALRMVGTNRDITERVHGEAATRELQAQLVQSQKMEAIGTLAAGIAHDFNNILGALLGHVVLAREDVGPSHRALGSLEQIHRSALRARALVQQILTFGRREPQRLVKRPMQPMIEESMAMLKASLPATVRVTTRLGGRVLHVMSDATQIQQVLINLCTNAWHSLDGGVGEIVVGLDVFDHLAEGREQVPGLAPGIFVRLSVRDTGCGIAPEVQARIFEPFFTTKPVGQGTGLGLAVVHGIVAAHGGAVTVRSAVGHGSEFTVFLPLVETGEGTALSGWGILAPHRSRGHGQRVLYVDDDEVVGVLAKALLERGGYEARYLQDPTAALQAFQEDPLAYDIVVTDFNMPVLTGLALAEQLRLVSPTLPIIVASGHLSDAQRRSLADVGVHDVVHKEAIAEELCASVDDVFTRMLREPVDAPAT